MGSEWWNPIKATEREFKNVGNLFSGDWAKINPFGLANEPGTPASRAADKAKAGQTVSTTAILTGQDQRQRSMGALQSGPPKQLLG